MDYLLKMVNSPEDLRKIPVRKLPMLCHEIREKIISAVSDNGGHLASNLGVVELTVALHRVFDVPNDAIVWDVGHQSYAHKILTGRKDDISGLRTKDGISGRVMVMEDGREAEVTPLREDRGALASLALFAVVAAALIAHSLLFA